MEIPAAASQPPQPLKVTCTTTDCERGLHCFLTTKKLSEQNLGGACRVCGVQLVDWSRLHSRQIADMEYTFEALRRELIRHHFAHVPISQRAIDYARKKGWRKLEVAVLNRLTSSIGPAQPFRDGTQTPREDSPKQNPIFYAQHGTATCCRRCVQEWYGIPLGVQLQSAEITYFAALVMRYLRERLPQVTDDGERVSQRRSKDPNKQ